MESQSFTGDANEDLYMLSTPDYFIDTGSYCEKSSVRKFAAYVLPPIYWSVFFLGLFGNGLIVIVYLTYKRLKTMTDTYLINLAIADILFLMTLPFWAISASHEWIFYTIPCKIVNSMYTITVYSGMLLLACISVDRYIAIVQATKAQRYRTRSIILSKLVSLSVWIFAVVLSLPEILFSTVKEGLSFKFCTMSYPIEVSKTLKVIVIALKVTMAFCMPLLVMIFSYALIIPTLIHARSFQKHKALKVIFAILSVFVLSQLPYNSILIVRVLDAANTTVSDCATSQNIDIAYKITQSIAFIHCCLNPFIYVFVGVKFRSDLFKFFSKFSCISESKSSARLKPNIRAKLPSEILETKMGTLSL
ncbi:C-C chemokine receptor type 9 [Spea bombifrons]|uniref:C-C chemokine receptor type 9 n=1 Tax=Spea bombifrons TaxID=233779 RepID=UPI002348F136|nr:C-C chemokine receptor type 9 [Spea bombifrons]